MGSTVRKSKPAEDMFLPYYCNTPEKLEYYPENKQKYKKPDPEQKDYDENTILCLYFQPIDYDEDNIGEFDDAFYDDAFYDMSDDFYDEDIYMDTQQCILFQPEENSMSFDKDINDDDLPDYDATTDTIDEADNFLLEDIDLDIHPDSLALIRKKSSSPMTRDL